MGLGVGHLVTKHTGLVQGQTYLHFVAPGLLAITAMQLAAGETMWPILGALKWVRTYHAAATTPLKPEDIVTGKLGWVSIRLFTTAAVYVVIISLVVVTRAAVRRRPHGACLWCAVDGVFVTNGIGRSLHDNLPIHHRADVSLFRNVLSVT